MPKSALLLAAAIALSPLPALAFNITMPTLVPTYDFPAPTPDPETTTRNATSG